MGLGVRRPRGESPEMNSIRPLTILQIITDIVPYADSVEDAAIRESIGRGELPVNTSTIPAPGFIKFALDLCWEKDPESRTQMGWCHTMLSHETTDLFNLFTKLPFEEVPARWRSGTSRRQVIFNPDSQTVYNVESLRSLGHVEGLRSEASLPRSPSLLICRFSSLGPLLLGYLTPLSMENMSWPLTATRCLYTVLALDTNRGA